MEAATINALEIFCTIPIDASLSLASLNSFRANIMAHDIVIRGGTIVDGTLNEAYTGDLAISGDTITDMGMFWPSH